MEALALSPSHTFLHTCTSKCWVSQTRKPANRPTRSTAAQDRLNITNNVLAAHAFCLQHATSIVWQHGLHLGTCQKCGFLRPPQNYQIRTCILTSSAGTSCAHASLRGPLYSTQSLDRDRLQGHPLSCLGCCSPALSTLSPESHPHLLAGMDPVLRLLSHWVPCLGLTPLCYGQPLCYNILLSVIL